MIRDDQTFALWGVMLVIVAFGLWSEGRPWGRLLGGPLLLIAVAMLAANTGLIPHTAPAYDAVAAYLVPVAIPLLLLRADLKTIVIESGPLLLAFLVAATATVVGALVGVAVVDMGALEPQIAGTVTASYIGGSLNFVATAEATGIRDSSIYVAGLSADAVGAVFFLLLVMALPTLALVRRAMPSRFPERAPAGRSATDQTDTAVSPGGVANGLAVSLVICGVSATVASLLDSDASFILLVTTLSLVVANAGKPLLRHVDWDFQLGTLFMYVFFVAIGAGADIGQVLGAALPIAMFISVMVIVHLMVLLAAGTLLKLDLAEVLVASNACILGPAPAAALAASRGWQPLIAPGILVGLLGYAVATFIGIGLATFLG